MHVSRSWAWPPCQMVRSQSTLQKGALLHLMPPLLEHADAVSVGEVAAEVQMTSPPRQSADDPSEEASSDGGSKEDSSGSEADDA